MLPPHVVTTAMRAGALAIACNYTAYSTTFWKMHGLVAAAHATLVLMRAIEEADPKGYAPDVFQIIRGDQSHLFSTHTALQLQCLDLVLYWS